MRVALLIPYTYVRFKVGGRVKEVCIDSFTPANISKPFRVAFTIYPYRRVRDLEAGSHSTPGFGAAIMLGREVSPWDALNHVIQIYRSIRSEVLSKAREAHLAHFIDVVVSAAAIPQFRSKRDGLGTELGELITATSLFESVLGREVLKDDPLVEDVRETLLTVPADLRKGGLLIDASTPIGRIYRWLLRADDRFSSALMKEVRWADTWSRSK